VLVNNNMSMVRVSMVRVSMVHVWVWYMCEYGTCWLITQ